MYSKYVVLINLSPPGAAHVHHWIGSALIQVTACCLFGAKHLSEPIEVFEKYKLL